MIKHLKIDSNGKYKYSRRVPEKLQSTLGKKQFSKVLGRTEFEAMRNYAPYHAHIEQLLLTTQPTSDADELLSIKAGIEAQFAELQLDPYSSGRSEIEKLARGEEVDRILSKYVFNPDTGHPDAEDVSVADEAMVAALLTGVDTIQAELSIKSAYGFYLSEKIEPDPFKRKKQAQRFSRSQRHLLQVTKQDIPLSKVNRAHARSLRDNLLKQMAVDSVRRNINDVKAVFSLVIREHDLNISNPFARLEYPKPADAAIDRRHPLPKEVILAMYEDLEDNQVLQDVWTLLHHTGAQNAEILGLKAKDLRLEADIPHFVIKPDGLRTVKVQARIRNVPLVGHALEVAKRLAANNGPNDDLFPQFSSTAKHDNFSQAARKRLRKFTDDRKHTVYSLRHTMKDALMQTGAGHRLELAILGHASERTSAAQYGSGVSLKEMQVALNRIEFASPAITNNTRTIEPSSHSGDTETSN